jgi:dTDP-4-amino-4,6-dideoxygalactose transaminase
MIRLVEPEMGEDEFQAVRRVLATGYLVQGQNVGRFEELVAAYLGLDHAVAVSSGTAALHVALLALGIGPGDEVIVPDFTFPATANVVALVGARPVLADVSLETFNLDPAGVEALITPRTRAIMPVHLFGLPAPMDEIQALAEAHGLWLIEDAACALGAEYGGRKCGTFGLLGCFSLHPRKAITTGEGGLIGTLDAELADRLRALRNHGQVAGPEGARFEAAGLNYRMTDFQGALGTVQMGKLEQVIGQRQALAAAYDAALAGIPWLRRPSVATGGSVLRQELRRAQPGPVSRHVYQSYVVLLEEGLDRERIMVSLREQGIECTIGTYACHAQPFFQRRYGYLSGDLPNAYHAFQRTLTLPLHGRMSPEDVGRVAGALRRSEP